MPIYEFYCSECNTIFNFFSRRVNTEKRPFCPKCSRGPIERVISKFAVMRGAKEKDNSCIPELNESKLENAMSMIEREANTLKEDNPKQAAKLMRKLCDISGLNLGSGMEEALRRMEAGEDPDKIEQDMGDILNEEEPFKLSQKTLHKLRKKPVERDETLYYL
ncbi:MAG: zinc ribbon domain-containing protein [Nitrospirae bacterium]|nr:zinc ribbon domain-containing protein [Nitrospirota bacterium]